MSSTERSIRLKKIHFLFNELHAELHQVVRTVEEDLLLRPIRSTIDAAHHDFNAVTEEL